MTRPAGYEWRYLPHGTVAHALRVANAAMAVCGVYTLPSSNWLGTGNQREHERVAELPCCKRCLSRMEREHT